MKPEIERALANIDRACAIAPLPRVDHLELVRNLKLIRDTLLAAETNKKPVKERKNAKQPKTDV